MRIAGLFLIVIVCTMVGISRYENDRKRIMLLDRMVMMLEDMRTAVRFESSSVTQLFLQCAANPTYDVFPFLKQIQKDIVSDCFSPTILVKRLEESSLNMALQRSDIQPLLVLITQLGTSDIEGQLAVIQRCKTQTETILRQENERCTRMGKLYISLGLCVGIGVALMLA